MSLRNLFCFCYLFVLGQLLQFLVLLITVGIIPGWYSLDNYGAPLTRQKSQLRFHVSPSHRILTVDQPIFVVTPKTPDARRGSHWNASSYVLGMTWPETETATFCTQSRCVTNQLLCIAAVDQVLIHCLNSLVLIIPFCGKFVFMKSMLRLLAET